MQSLLIVLCVLLGVAVIGLVWAIFAFYGRIRHAEREAIKRYDSWRDRHLERIRAEIQQQSSEQAQIALEKWKADHESAIRQDAINRSSSVVVGKVGEQLAPYVENFPFNPRDARFIGSPIDMVVFDGAEDGCIEQVVLLEIKTAGSQLSIRQRQVREAVQRGRVVWQELRL